MNAPEKSPLLSVVEALSRVLANVTPLNAESAAINAAAGRTLAEDVRAKLTQPPFNASAMDGYAVRAAEIAVAPVTLALQGIAAAGRPFAMPLKSGHAVRIFTGAPLPEGSDCVVLQEDARADDEAITLFESVRAGHNVRPAGQDFHDGQTLLSKGRRLTARDILLATGAGHAHLTVIGKPLVAILATGDELVPPGSPPGPGQIVASNSTALAVLVETAGGHPIDLGIARDTHESLAEKIAAAEDADVLITTGGASVGDHDLVRPELEKAGATLDFYKIAMRPGKPMFYGTRRRADGTLQRVLGLPGNPISALIGARVFLVPLMAALLGRTETAATITATLQKPIGPNGPREHYARAKLDLSTIPPRVTVLPNQDSALTAAFAAADCLAIIPAGANAMAAGEPIRILPLDF